MEDNKTKQTDTNQGPTTDNLQTNDSAGSTAADDTSSATQSDTHATPETAGPSGVAAGGAELEAEESSMTPIIVGVVILVLGVIAAVWFFTSQDQAVDGLTAQIDDTAPAEFDGDPDEVVATVNGTDLTRAEYNRIRQQVLQNAQQMGMDINDPETIAQVDAQAVDTLINTELIRQAAVAAGASANSEEIEARFADIVAQVGGEEALESSLAQLGLTESSLRADIEQELIIQSYLESSIDTDDLAATDAEVDELYEASGGAEGGLPPIDEVRPQIEQQILANKENELINELVESLRADAEIEVQI